MSDRSRRAPRPCDENGAPLIDAGVLRMILKMTPAGARRWAQRHGIPVVRRGAHGAWMYRLDDVQDVLGRDD